MNVAAIFSLYKSIVPPVYANEHIAAVMSRVAAEHRVTRPILAQDEAEKTRMAREAIALATELAGRGA